MDKLDKHTPLSPEELFELLEKSHQATDFDGFDDFEKDALEGFSVHVNSKTARALNGELNDAISKRVLETQSEKNNKVLWFSAAASIFLIISVSVFLFNRSKEDSQTTIAVNEITEHSTAVVSPAGAVPALESHLEMSVSDTETAGNLIKQPLAQLQEEKLENKSDQSGYFETKEANHGDFKNKLEQLSTDNIEKATTRNNDEIKQQSKVFAAKKVTVYEQSSSKLAEEKLTDELAAPSELITTNTVTKDRVTLYGNSQSINDGEFKTLESKNSNENENSEKQDVGKSASEVTEDAFTTVVDVKPAVALLQNPNLDSYALRESSIVPENAKKAFYTGNEIAISNYVKSYFKEKEITNQAAGKFKISGIVDTKGNFKVLDIIQITRNNCNCINDIKNALNSMTKWVPAVTGDKSVSSKVEFVISF